MIVSAKHRVLLWVPTLLFSYLILGDLGRDGTGALTYHVSVRGFIASVLIILAATFIHRGERAGFAAGIVLWILALLSLLLEDSVLMTIHF